MDDEANIIFGSAIDDNLSGKVRVSVVATGIESAVKSAERHRLVVVGYFLEGRKSQELATFLGVTESRISQLRSEALEMLREGITAQYEAEQGETEAPQGRVARRKAGYASAIGEASHWHDRIGAEKVATA